MSVIGTYRKILCYGDSNTYGYDARSPFGDRFPDEYCWPYRLGRALDAVTVNAGMNGRCIPRSDYAIAVELASVKRALPCDLIIVMLGSNDILSDVCSSAGEIAEKMKAFLYAFTRAAPDAAFLLIAPPEIAFSPEMRSCSVQLSLCYKALAREMGILFADAGEWALPLAWDGVHFTAEGHRIFAERTAALLRTFSGSGRAETS